MAVAARSIRHSGSWCPSHNPVRKKRKGGGVIWGARPTWGLTRALSHEIGGGSGSTASPVRSGLRLGSKIFARASSAAVMSDARELESIAELHAELPFSREVWSTFMEGYWQKRPVVIRGAIARCEKYDHVCAIWPPPYHTAYFTVETEFVFELPQVLRPDRSW